MYVYIESETGLWTVGFYNPNGEWMAESEHKSKDEAAARVAYLNGGRHMDDKVRLYTAFDRFMAKHK